MMHRDALDKAEDRQMELFREAWKRSKLSHGQVNERHQKQLFREAQKRLKLSKTEECNDPVNDNDGESVDSLCSSDDSLCSIFYQIKRQDLNIEESEKRLIQARNDAKKV